MLGVSVSASPVEIKKAFKVKAKLLHPDVNKSPRAHEEFLVLYEAFGRLISENQEISKPRFNISCTVLRGCPKSCPDEI
ncbi:MAG: DnaJ domain-containing protein [Paludibacteraceae bacterium]|nr:DnaJ domain-containing protein [Paludibacteraceae bacterium]